VLNPIIAATVVSGFTFLAVKHGVGDPGAPPNPGGTPMSDMSNAHPHDGTPMYTVAGDPGLGDCYPAWLDNLADAR
jgi:hypothetical protein